MKNLILLLAAFCIFAVMLAGCSDEKEQGEITPPSSSSVQEIVISQNESQEEEIVKKPEYTTIKTKYGYLFYPDRWNEFFSATQEEKD